MVDLDAVPYAVIGGNVIQFDAIRLFVLRNYPVEGNVVLIESTPMEPSKQSNRSGS